VADLRPLCWVGTISYSLYLWHLPVYLWAVRALPDAPLWQLVAVAVPGSFLAAFVSFALVERWTLPRTAAAP
jgi:peptidoglycan/LPS O-acetylase OafA/YrhL